ncbi:RNA-binding protein 4B [Branchiostoma belcheri]|nr:RNA-binding protein 4B [Branchiostoma belcheri]
MATKLYFGNLSPDITLDMLKNLLLEYDVPIVPDTVQLKNHFAFVEVQDNATAEETIRKLHGYNFHGSVMTVEHSVQRNRGRYVFGTHYLVQTTQFYFLLLHSYVYILFCSFIYTYGF